MSFPDVANIPESKLRETCDNAVFVKVSKNFSGWRDTARHLPGLKQSKYVVEAIEKGNFDEEGKGYLLLCRWKELVGSLATNGNLIQGLFDAKRTNLAEEVASELHPQGESFEVCEWEWPINYQVDCSCLIGEWSSSVLYEAVCILPIILLYI